MLYMDVKGKFTNETLFFLGLDCVFVFAWVEAEEFQVALFWWKLQGNLFIDLFFCLEFHGNFIEGILF